jgi:Uma2 family endonuclease
MTAIPLEREVEYPESDGQPMGETEVHRDEIIDLIKALEDHFRDAADVHVSGDLFLYYKKDDPRSVICPDVFVAKGVAKGQRRIYKLWEEGQPPCLVIEVTSRDTRGADLGKKKDCYERLGVKEYFLYDPLGEYLEPPLQGFRLVGGRYRPLAPAADGALASPTTGLVLRPEGGRLRLLDAADGEPLLRVSEVQERARREAAARQAAEERAEREAAARREAEAELARLRRELERRR